MPRFRFLVAAGGVVAFLFLAFLLVTPSSALANEVGTGGHWTEVACGTAFTPEEGPCYEAAGEVEEGVIMDESEWLEMVESYEAWGYDYAGEAVPGEVTSTAKSAGAEIETGVKSFDAESVVGAGGEDVESGAMDLLERGAWAPDFAAGLGAFAAAGTAFYVGWEVGSAIDSIFGIGGASGSTGTSSGSTTYMEPQTYLARDPGAVIHSSGSCNGTFLLLSCTNVVAPTAGWVVSWAAVGTGKSTRTEMADQPTGKSHEVNFFVPQKTPEGAERLSTETYTANAGKSNEETYPFYVWFIPAHVTGLGSTSGAGSVRKSTLPTAPKASTAKTAAEAVLKNPADDEFNGWAWHHGAKPKAAPKNAIADPTAEPIYSVPARCHVGAERSACSAALTELDLVPEVTELDWEHAVVEELEVLEPEKTREEEADRITEVPSPLPTEIEKGQKFAFTVNPPLEDMPEFVPEPGTETAEEYRERKVPWIPAPFWHPEELDDATLDPTKGPSEITHLSPAAGTRVNPDGETAEHVDVNPDDAPVPAEGGGAFTPPAVPAIAAPLSGIEPCGVFPFGLFCWIKGAISELTATPKCPTATVPLKVDGHEDGIEMGFCSVPEVEHWIGLWRKLVVFFFTIGCAWTFAKATGAIGSGGDE